MGEQATTKDEDRRRGDLSPESLQKLCLGAGEREPRPPHLEALRKIDCECNRESDQAADGDSGGQARAPSIGSDDQNRRQGGDRQQDPEVERSPPVCLSVIGSGAIESICPA